MLKIFLYLLIPFSLLIHPASAKNCGTGLGIVWNLGSAGSEYLASGYYTSVDSYYAGELIATINGDMYCDADYMDGVTGISRMIMRLNDGLQCKDSSTISIDGVTGAEWKLTGMVCENNKIRSTTTKSTPWDQKAKWPNGTTIGSAKLLIGSAYWKNYHVDDHRSVMIPSPSFGLGVLDNSPTINVGSVIEKGRQMNIYNQGTCTMSLSTENLNFGRLSPPDINNGNIKKDFYLDYSCKNKGAVNGVYIKYEPEHTIDASQGTFSAKDKSGNNLIFKISTPSYSNRTIPLNTLWPMVSPSASDTSGRVYYDVQVMPSTPLPSGAVSTYLNVSLVYR
ncbi:fimbrial subunit [Citrobacter braakii]|uniref:fimbrial protein n=1 Tax=Citrobacter TaxID=544 RepID=UPI000E17C9DC|nr:MULTISPECIES: fimbrial protein [Citrobacter]ELN4155723.1 fimbrial protein [Citrobacter braakii]MBJ9047113.1 fimbrial protein [Citrobacter braakii]MBM3062462.1 fimbrial protein [Citrobacter braakii]MBM3066927.1 fimbrial protein [Citrobacter braakii]MBP5854272.1 fimbrial protein [Citrobacter sp. AN-PRR1]